MTLALNIILMTIVSSVVVGGLAWSILNSRDARQPRPARSSSAQPSYGLRTSEQA
jgi:hypothetical protein